MEFKEKLQELRKSRGLTQEELAAQLYVSRTAISKWESGRGYPSIDSLKEISSYFSVSLDELLSAEKVLTIAEKENRSNIRGVCDLLFGIADLFSFMLIILPLYPNRAGDFIHSVSLWAYTDIASWVKPVYLILFVSLISLGIIKIILTKLRAEKGNKAVTVVSVLLSCFTVLLLALTREAYALVLVFLLLGVKALLLLGYKK
ncbi:MAG: helix-turn-helix transcriptional regulator [Clostridia bacterium]|nr:helix-turn-helix transcriptional regulator [Clostridia bacterium]